jgi:hypothetical protein
MSGWRKRTIMEMAKEAGVSIRSNWAEQELEAFAKLVREDEREACAKVCESYTDKSDSDHEAHGYACAIAIRARGQA